MTGICDSLTNYWSNDYFRNFFEQTEKADLIFLEIAKQDGNLDFIEEDINNSVHNIMLLMDEHGIDNTHAKQIIRKRFQDIDAFKDKFKEMKNELNQFKRYINSFARIAPPDVINEITLLPNELMYKVKESMASEDLKKTFGDKIKQIISRHEDKVQDIIYRRKNKPNVEKQRIK